MYGAVHAIRRRVAKHRGERADREQKGRSTWDNEIEGALCELAYCKRHGTYWSGMTRLRARDGGSVEIRWTGYPNGGLIIYDHDDDEAVVVLGKGYAPTYSYVGYIKVAEGRRLGERTDFGILVPASRLKPLEVFA